MMITSILEENQAAFEHLIPEEMFGRLKTSEYFGFGAVETINQDGADTHIAVGVLIFSVDEGSNRAENFIAAQLKWLYVAEDFRNKGAGDALVPSFFNAMRDSGVAHILCDIPMPAEYDDICAYLEEWGFIFQLTDLFEATLTLSEILEHPAFKTERTPAHSVALSQVAAIDFEKFIQKAKRLPGVVNLSKQASGYEEDVSCVYVQNHEIQGGLLLFKDAAGTLELLLLRAFEQSGTVLSDMMLFATKAAALKYPLETPVHIVCRLKAAATTLNRMFPRLQPPIIRRGYFNVYDNGEES